MALTGVDHKRLVEAHIDGDDEAFAAIVRAYYESLFAHAMRRTGDAHTAEDAVQETLSRAYRALPRFSGDYQLRAWLHRILTNVCHDEGRRRRRETQTFERVAATHSEVPPVDNDLAVLDLPRREVLDALAALPASYRDALVLRYVEELSFHDVAEVTGISEGNARLRVHRGRAALRRALAPLAGFVVFLAPFLRRGQRAALAAQLGAESHVGLVASAPVATRVAEAGMVLADKAPSLPSMIGVAASLMVPAALPALSDSAHRRTHPPAAVAAPLEAEPVAATPVRTDRSGEAPATAVERQAPPVAAGALPAPPTTTSTVDPATTVLPAPATLGPAEPAGPRAPEGPASTADGETPGRRGPDAPAPGASGPGTVGTSFLAPAASTGGGPSQKKAEVADGAGGGLTEPTTGAGSADEATVEPTVPDPSAEDGTGDDVVPDPGTAPVVEPAEATPPTATTVPPADTPLTGPADGVDEVLVALGLDRTGAADTGDLVG